MRAARLVGLGAVLALATAPRDGARAQSSIENRLLAAQPGNTLVSRIGSDDMVALVSRDQVSSRAVDLRRLTDRLRGRVGDQQADLTLEPHHVGGDIGGRPVSLDLLPRGPRALTVVGRFGNRTVALQIDPAHVTGEIGPCMYRTEHRGDAYVGQVTCGGSPEAVELRFPAVFVARSDVELAAILTAILAR